MDPTPGFPDTVPRDRSCFLVGVCSTPVVWRGLTPPPLLALDVVLGMSKGGLYNWLPLPGSSPSKLDYPKKWWRVKDSWSHQPVSMTGDLQVVPPSWDIHPTSSPRAAPCTFPNFLDWNLQHQASPRVSSQPSWGFPMLTRKVGLHEPPQRWVAVDGNTPELVPKKCLGPIRKHCGLGDYGQSCWQKYVLTFTRSAG